MLPRNSDSEFGVSKVRQTCLDMWRFKLTKNAALIFTALFFGSILIHEYTGGIIFKKPKKQAKIFIVKPPVIAMRQNPSSETKTRVGTTTRPMVRVCKPTTAEALGKVKTTKYGIPFIIHQIYKDRNVPQQYVKLIESCGKINPDFIQVMWTDKDSEAFVKKEYPHLQSLYAKYVEGAQKSDFFRVLLLYHFGGVYVDMDFECKKPFATNLDQFNSSAILDQERRLQTRLRWNRNFTAMNSVMIGRKKHPFFKYLVDKFPDSLHHGNVMWRTGPFYVHDRYLEYQRKTHPAEDTAVIAPSSAFSPVLDPSLFGLFSGKCRGDYNRKSDAERRGCIEWDALKRRQDNVKELIKDSVGIHWFMHLVYSFMRGAIKTRVDICTVVDTLHQYVPDQR